MNLQSEPSGWDEQFEALRKEYCVGVSEKIADFQKFVLYLEAQPDSADLFNAIYRVVHSLKGSGGTYGYSLFTDLSSCIESLLDMVRKRQVALTAPVFNTLLTYADLITLSVQMARDGQQDFSSFEARKGALFNSVTEFGGGLHALRPANASPVTPGRPPDTTRHSRAKGVVMIAASSKLMAQKTKEVLATGNYDVIESSDGLEALRLAVETRADIVITEIELSSLSGHALTAAIKSDPVMQATKVVYLTSSKSALTDAVCMPDAVVFKDTGMAANLARILTLL